MERTAYTMVAAIGVLAKCPQTAASLLLCDIDYHLPPLLLAPTAAVRECALAAMGLLAGHEVRVPPLRLLHKNEGSVIALFSKK